jgi:outer membrane protein assembly factor BamB
MGIKGDKMTADSNLSAENMQNRLAKIGNIRIKRMFGGHGIFEEDKMFALIDQDGTVYFGAKNGKMWAVNPDGTVKWEKKIAENLAGSSAVLAPDGTIYVSNFNGFLYHLKDKGVRFEILHRFNGGLFALPGDAPLADTDWRNGLQNNFNNSRFNGDPDQ